MEPPKIPNKCLDLLKVLCSQSLHAENGMTLLMDLALNRPRKLHYLSVLLDFCSHANEEVILIVPYISSLINCYKGLCDNILGPKPSSFLCIKTVQQN